MRLWRLSHADTDLKWECTPWIYHLEADLLTVKAGGILEDALKKFFDEVHVEDLTIKISYAIGYLEDDNKVSKQDFINFLRELIY